MGYYGHNNYVVILKPTVYSLSFIHSTLFSVNKAVIMVLTTHAIVTCSYLISSCYILNAAIVQFVFSCYFCSMEYSHCGIVARLLVVSLIAVCCSGESDTSTQLLFINYY